MSESRRDSGFVDSFFSRKGNQCFSNEPLFCFYVINEKPRRVLYALSSHSSMVKKVRSFVKLMPGLVVLQISEPKQKKIQKYFLY